MKAKKLLIPGIVLVLILSVFSSAICIVGSGNNPNAPDGLSITSSPYDADGDIILSWNEPGFEDYVCEEGERWIDHYNVFKSTDNTNFVKIAETSELTYEDLGLTQGVTYYYYVTAVDNTIDPVNGDHESEPSDTKYTTIGTASLFCGDGTCNNGEDCSTCPADCGNCGGGGGGGGGGAPTNNDDWDCSDCGECIDGTQECTCYHTIRTGVTKKETVDCEVETPVTTTSGDSGDTFFGEEDEEEDEEEAGVEVLGGSGEDTGPTGAAVGVGGRTPWLFLIILIALITALLLLFLYKKRNKRR